MSTVYNASNETYEAPAAKVNTFWHWFKVLLSIVDSLTDSQGPFPQAVLTKRSAHERGSETSPVEFSNLL